MNIAIITARGGSKRIPRKNIRHFAGKPMLAWPIAAAKESGCFEHILISTEDEEIAEIALKFGAEVPFLRPKELADDHSHAHKAARHALEWAIEKWGPIETFCHLYPTAPLLTSATITKGFELIKQGATNVYTMQRVPFPLFQVVRLDKTGELIPFFDPEKAAMRSQDMPAFFIDAGQMYWFATKYFFENETSIGPKTRMVEVSRESSVDIDTEEDWLFAERLAAIFFGEKSIAPE